MLPLDEILNLNINFQLKASNEMYFYYDVNNCINKCYGVTKDQSKNDYLLVLKYAKNGDLHNNLSKNFNEYNI